MRALICSVIATCSITGAYASEHSVTPPQSVECIAVFELMQRAAPDWSQQYSVQDARRSWHGIARDLAAQAEMSLVEQVQQRMSDLADLTIIAPETLSQKAMTCIADAPA